MDKFDYIFSCLGGVLMSQIGDHSVGDMELFDLYRAFILGLVGGIGGLMARFVAKRVIDKWKNGKSK